VTWKLLYKAEIRLDLRKRSAVVLPNIFQCETDLDFLLEFKVANKTENWKRVGKLYQKFFDVPDQPSKFLQDLNFGRQVIAVPVSHYGRYQLQFEPKDWIGKTNISLFKFLPDQDVAS